MQCYGPNRSNVSRHHVRACVIRNSSRPALPACTPCVVGGVNAGLASRFTACWRGFQITRKRKNRSYNDGFVVVSSATKDGAKHATLLDEHDSKLSSALLPSLLRLADDVPGVYQTVAHASCYLRLHQPRSPLSLATDVLHGQIPCLAPAVNQGAMACGCPADITHFEGYVVDIIEPAADYINPDSENILTAPLARPTVLQEQQRSVQHPAQQSSLRRQFRLPVKRKVASSPWSLALLSVNGQSHLVRNPRSPPKSISADTIEPCRPDVTTWPVQAHAGR